MQAHRGLPKNLPQRKVKAKIFSTGLSTAKSTDSPINNDDTLGSSESKTHKRQSSLGQSQSRHKIKSKQKPIKSPAPVQKWQENERNQRQQMINHRAREEGGKNQFVQAVLGMMSQLSSNKNSDPMTNISMNDKNTRNLQVEHQFDQKQGSMNVIQNAEKSANDFHFRHPNKSSGKLTKVQEQKIMKRCSYMLEDSSSWVNYVGQKKQQLHSGYGILYFKNKDKFMGGFKQNLANGHGSYYLHDMRKRLMAVWVQNKISLAHGFVIQNL